MKVLAAAAATAALVLLAACGSSAKKASAPPPTTTTTTTGAPTTQPATTAPPTSAPPPASDAGAINLTVRSPLSFAGTVPTSVVCDNERGHYAAEASGFMVGHDTVSMSVNISGYGTPKTYSTPVTVEFLAPDGTSDKVTENISLKIVDPKHGQFTITGTDDLGKKVDADFNWTCS